MPSTYLTELGHWDYPQKDPLMNKRASQRTAQKLPIRLHFFGDQTDVSESQDISAGGFYVCTDSVRQLAKGVVALLLLLIL